MKRSATPVACWRAGNCFDWSSWDDAAAALAEADGFIARIAAGDLPDRHAPWVLFAPTGPVQECSLSSGWGDEFLAVAERFDAAAARAFA